MMNHFGKNFKLIRQLTKRLQPNGFQERNSNGLTTEFTSEVEKPLFISDFPFEQGITVFDAFFNLDSNMWSKFDMQKSLSKMLISHNE